PSTDYRPPSTVHRPPSTDPPPQPPRHTNPTTTGHKQHNIAVLGAAAALDGVVQGHGHAGRAGVAPLIHHPVRLLQWLLQQAHRLLDGVYVELREDEEIDVIHRQARFLHQLVHQYGPVLAGERCRELTHKLHARRSFVLP